MLSSRDALKIYLRDFRQGHHGHDHDLLELFRSIGDLVQPEHVVYPGSFVHVTPSLVFPSVTYIDSLQGFQRAMEADDLHEWVGQHADYDTSSEINVLEASYKDIPIDLHHRFDLLLSLNAGAISQECKNLLKPDGYLLVNDGHYDASRAHIDGDYQLIAALHADGARDIDDELRGYFLTKRGEPLTLPMVQANEQRSPSRAPFKMKRDADAFLFRFQ